MTDYRPNPDDPSPRDPRIARRDPMQSNRLGRDATGGAMWGWIAGIAVLVLIGFIVVGGWGSGSRTGTDTASNAPARTSAPARTTPPATTTGSAPTESGAPPSPPMSR